MDKDQPKKRLRRVKHKPLKKRKTLTMDNCLDFLDETRPDPAKLLAKKKEECPFESIHPSDWRDTMVYGAMNWVKNNPVKMKRSMNRAGYHYDQDLVGERLKAVYEASDMQDLPPDPLGMLPAANAEDLAALKPVVAGKAVSNTYRERALAAAAPPPPPVAAAHPVAAAPPVVVVPPGFNVIEEEDGSHHFTLKGRFNFKFDEED